MYKKVESGRRAGMGGRGRERNVEKLSKRGHPRLQRGWPICPELSPCIFFHHFHNLCTYRVYEKESEVRITKIGLAQN